MSRIARIRSAPAEPAPPLVEELTPTPDPWDVARRLAQRDGFLFLDSAATDSPLGRYSFVMADAFAHLQARGQAMHCPFLRLAEQLARFPAETIAGLPPFQGGAAGL